MIQRLAVACLIALLACGSATAQIPRPGYGGGGFRSGLQFLASAAPGGVQNILAVNGSASNTSTTTGTTALCANGSAVVVALHTGTTSTTSFALTDSSGLGNVYSLGTTVSASGRLMLFRTKLTADLPAGTTFTFTQTAANAPQVLVGCFPALTAYVDTTSAGASGTSTTPSQTTASITTQPMYVVFGMWTNGSGPTITPNGSFTALGPFIGSGNFGSQMFWQKYTGSVPTTLTFAPSALTSNIWGLNYLTGSTP